MKSIAVTEAHFTFDSRAHYEAGIDLHIVDYSTGLIRRGESGFHVLTGIDVGLVGASIELLDSSPREDSADWEDVVEFQLAAESRAAVVHDYFEQASVVDVDLGSSGNYIVRVSARGRDLGLDGSSMMEERYRLQFWEGPTVPGARWAAAGSSMRVIRAISEANTFRQRTLHPMPPLHD